MTNVEYQTKMLIREIKKSNEYNQFRRLAGKLARHPELKEKVDCYRRERFALQNADRDTAQALQDLEAGYAELLSASPVREYLISEQKLIYMLQGMLLSITEAVNLDLDL